MIGPFGPFFFAVGRGHVDLVTKARCEEIAQENAAAFVSVNMPGEGWRYWFEGPNRGDPFDRELAKTVLGQLAAEGIELPGLPLRPVSRK